MLLLGIDLNLQMQCDVCQFELCTQIILHSLQAQNEILLVGAVDVFVDTLMI